MNFLQLVQRACRECGISSDNLLTIVGQTGEARRMVEWVNSAYTDILASQQDWGFLRTSASWATIAGQATYTPTEAGTSNFGSWIRNSFRCYNTAAGVNSEIQLGYMDYDYWRDVYQYGSNRTTTSQPTVVTITPARAIGLGPVPAVGYTITGDYFTKPVEMSGDTGAHVIPSQHELAIVYRAMMSYGAYESATEVYQRGELEYKKIMTRLRNEYLPEVTLG